MEFDQLRFFKAVAEEGSVSRAAEKLNCVQSNVTYRIHQLEDGLKVSLFQRKSRGVALTPLGHAFLAYTNRILALYDEAVSSVQEKDIPCGTLTIGAMELFAAMYIPSVFSEYRRIAPLVELHLIAGTSEIALNNLLEHHVDAAFVGGAIAHPDLNVEMLFKEELVLACPKGESPFLEKGKLDILFFRKGCALRAQLETWLHDRNISYRIMEFGSVEAILGCLASGVGKTCLPRSIFSDGEYADLIDIYELPSELAFFQINFITHRKNKESKAIEIFRSTVNQWKSKKLSEADQSLRKGRMKRSLKSSRASLQADKAI